MAMRLVFMSLAPSILAFENAVVYGATTWRRERRRLDDDLRRGRVAGGPSGSACRRSLRSAQGFSGRGPRTSSVSPGGVELAAGPVARRLRTLGTPSHPRPNSVLLPAPYGASKSKSPRGSCDYRARCERSGAWPHVTGSAEGY